MFNILPKHVRMICSCAMDRFKSQLDDYRRSISDLPCQSVFNYGLDGGDCINGSHYVDVLAAN